MSLLKWDVVCLVLYWFKPLSEPLLALGEPCRHHYVLLNIYSIAANNVNDQHLSYSA